MEEEFRICIENNNYSVSNFGRVRNNKTNKILKGSLRRGYLRVQICTKGERHFFSIHRLVATEFIDNPLNKPFIDHIDNNKSNNNAYNLRWCSQKENNCNVGLNTNNSSGVKGVCYNKSKRQWVARIRHDGIDIYIGTFKTIEEAIYARMKKANELFGEFVNKIEKLEEEIHDLRIEAIEIDID